MSAGLAAALWVSGESETAAEEQRLYRKSAQQQQKIYPQEEQRLGGIALGIFAIILSSIGFFLTVAGIVASAIVLQYANGQQAVLVGGIIGLLSSIGAMLICIAIFVVSVVVVALRTRRVRSRM